MEVKTPKATHQGNLEIGHTNIDCAVLEDSTRLITQRSFNEAIGRSRSSGSLKENKGAHQLPRFLAPVNLRPYISDELRCASIPIEFLPEHGGRTAYGFKAELLPEVCKVYLDAQRAGTLSHSQHKFAIQCEILLHAFAKVGVIALVDEATGYQDFRVKDALARILEKFIAEEYRAWTKTFPDDFYREIFRLKGWPWDPKSVKRPSVIGHYTNDIIYDRLAPGALEELRRINPPTEKGHRKQKHHQWLTGKVGNPTLKSIIDGSMALMRAAPNWRKFKEMLNRSYPKYGDNIALALEFDEDHENK